MDSNNNSAGVFSAQESWASNLSNYILLRRQQTYAAYKKQSTDVNQADNNADLKSSLFNAFVILSANQLEEGHTVLTLSESNNSKVISVPVSNRNLDDTTANTSENITQNNVKLYDWQLQLIELLAAPILDFIDTNTNDKPQNEVSATDLLYKVLTEILEKKEQLLWHVPLNHKQINPNLINKVQIDKSEKHHLIQRIDLIVKVVEYFQNYQSKPLSLQSLVDEFEQNALFSSVSPVENSLSKTNTPILYHFRHINETKQDNSSLTIWLHRAWQAEYNLALKIKRILNHNVRPLDIELSESLNEQQIKAIETANNNAFSIITGGPGTGKTYTVAQLVMALHKDQYDETCELSDTTESDDEYKKPRVKEGSNNDIKSANTKTDFKSSSLIEFRNQSASLALAAPTGKAAQRMQESLQSAIDSSNSDLQLQDAKTIHRLLGIGRTGKPRYNADNPLGEDIIIVDEASMLGVELANYLVSAIKPGARLILLGDANQLAAVDAGAVLADLCRIPELNPIHVELTESRRFHKDSGIGQLAYLINQNTTDLQKILKLLNEDASLKFVNIYDEEFIDKQNSLSRKKQNYSLKMTSQKLFQNFYQEYLLKTKELLENPLITNNSDLITAKISDLMECFNEFRILSAGHHGEWGDVHINQILSNWHTSQLKLPIRQDAWYHGRPIMVLQNNYELGLFNGDIGICLLTNTNNLEVFFENKTQGIAVNLLNEELITTAYAMTIHKSQGSEFEHVAISLDKSHTRLLSKELIYTAVTRAKNKVTIFSSIESFETAIDISTQRNTGLELQFHLQGLDK